MALIKCPDCGRDVSNRIENCIHCGAPLSSKPIAEQNPVMPPQPKAPTQQVTHVNSSPVYHQPAPPTPTTYAEAVPIQTPHNDLRCPKCGSKHLQVSNEIKTTGKNYNAATGCLGWLIAGPIGLLCGLCGANKRTQSKSFWKCVNCGHSFKDATTLKEEIKAHNVSMIAMIALGVIITVTMFITSLVAFADHESEVGFGLLLSSGFGLAAIGMGLCYKKPKDKLVKELKDNFGIDP